MKYTVTKIEKRETQAGKPYISATLETEGVETERVGIFDNLDAFVLGGEVEGDLKQNDKGYWNFYFPRTQKAGGQGREASMTRVMDRKEKSIENAQDRKMDGIRMAGAQRDATLMLTTLIAAKINIYLDKGDDEIDTVSLKADWKKWRDFFYNAYDEQINEPFND